MSESHSNDRGLNDIYLVDYTLNHEVRYSASRVLCDATDTLRHDSASNKVECVCITEVDPEELVQVVLGDNWWEEYPEQIVKDDMLNICYNDCRDDVLRYVESKYKH